MYPMARPWGTAVEAGKDRIEPQIEPKYTPRYGKR